MSIHLLSVYMPDEVNPYDSYALKSLELHTNRKLKELASYYEAVENFRIEYFPEKSKEVFISAEHSLNALPTWFIISFDLIKFIK